METSLYWGADLVPMALEGAGPGQGLSLGKEDVNSVYSRSPRPSEMAHQPSVQLDKAKPYAP